MEERVGFGAHKLELKPGATREERLHRSRAMLSRVLNLRTTVAFVGAGCSIPLGYPSWTEFAGLLVAHALETCQSVSNDYKAAHSRMLERFKWQLESGPVRPHQIMFILGECKKVFEQCDSTKHYYKLLRKTFRPRQYPAGVLNPYDALLELPIRRFITTNYDREIEKALSRKGEVAKKEFVLHRKRVDSPDGHRDFTQEHAYNDQLALFALARVIEAENMVFHCHGHYNRPESLVVTEADYQYWYLGQESGGGTALGQTISLLFGSNPILFVGYGMGDDDLLGTLRMFVAVDPDRKSARPLFALIAERAEGQDEDDHRFYYERYGVNVIPYPVPKEEDRSRALCEALTSVNDNWIAWREGWLQKPVIRKIDIEPKPPAPYHHYPLISEDMPDFGGERVRELLDDLLQKAEQGTQLIALVGPGGTGKSWYAQQLMETLQNKETRFRGFFFWSSYYADDSLTGIDRALCYLGRNWSTKISRVERFQQCLREGSYFMVFDGIERFLRETENPEEGHAFEPNTTDFLAAMAHKDNRSTVLLTSRL